MLQLFLKSAFVLCFLQVSPCDHLEKNDDVQEKVTVQILFVGNSLTYSNDLPKLVANIAKEAGYKVKTQTLAFPNYALEDHWLDGSLQKLIASGKFEYVVVQQGPSSQNDGREMLQKYGLMISDMCIQHGSKLAFFMVWPAKQNYHMFEGVIRNYNDAAVLSKAILCPVGLEWKNYIDRTNDFSYYGSDGFHPSVAGSNKAAEVIVKSIFNK